VSRTPLRIDEPKGGRASLSIVLAPGAGAGMDCPFMEEVARALAANSLRVVRFDFPYMQEARQTGRKAARPDAPEVLVQTWMQVIGELGEPSRLVIGGKSMGGRIASMVADRAGVRGLVCLGYPFHLPDGDHSFKPRKGSGRSYQQNMAQAVQEIVKFCVGL
jgi:predicted alpha/beta-hydrolase family hydrolase